METTQRPTNGSRWQGISERLHRPIRAMVVDLFRILSGCLISVYFIRLFLEFSTYTSELGLLDHDLHREIFWFSKVTLFFPGSPEWYKASLLVLGFVGALMLTVGWNPRLGAATAWILAVSAHRWNFAVINVDDSSITLLLWWMLFMPIGNTLTWKTWRDKSLKEEASLTVDGFFVRAFFVNLFIYYLTAGLTKLWSPLWREGLALFVVLQLPLARTHGWWQVEHMPILWWGNHLTLILEPLFPFMVFLPKNHPLKWLGGITLFLFHLSIPITIGVPYANLGLILTLVLIFHEEIGDMVNKRWGADSAEFVEASRPAGLAKRLIATYLVVLALAMSKGIPVLEKAYEPAMATLYWGGVAQEYHLFDWIDRFNWYVSHTVTVHPHEGEPFQVPSTDMFPASVRGFIIQSYLLPMRWMRITRPLTGEMRNSVMHRASSRFARIWADKLGPSGYVVVDTVVGRVNRDNLLIEETWPTKLMKFHYNQGVVAEFEYPRLSKVEAARREQ